MHVDLCIEPNRLNPDQIVYKQLRVKDIMFSKGDVLRFGDYGFEVASLHWSEEPWCWAILRPTFEPGLNWDRMYDALAGHGFHHNISRKSNLCHFWKSIFKVADDHQTQAARLESVFRATESVAHLSLFLERLEYSGSLWDIDGYKKCCPICEAIRPFHKPGCEMATMRQRFPVSLKP